VNGYFQSQDFEFSNETLRSFKTFLTRFDAIFSKRRVDTIDLTASAHVRHTSFCG